MLILNADLQALQGERNWTHTQLCDVDKIKEDLTEQIKICQDEQASL
jgi:hypothetical protein